MTHRPQTRSEKELGAALFLGRHWGGFPRSARIVVGAFASCALIAAVSLGVSMALLATHEPRVVSTGRASAGHDLPASESATALGPFGWLTSTTPPANWGRVTLPSGLGTVSVPPGFRTVRGDAGTLSLARLSSHGTYLGYLNTTPLQGHERLQNWAVLRVAHLREDDAISAHQDAAVESVRVGEAVRSCVTDDYVTRVGHHQFHEVACLVMTRSGGAVVVAATPVGDPAHLLDDLERAVAGFPFV